MVLNNMHDLLRNVFAPLSLSLPPPLPSPVAPLIDDYRQKPFSTEIELNNFIKISDVQHIFFNLPVSFYKTHVTPIPLH